MTAEVAVESPGVRRSIALLSTLIIGLIALTLYVLPGRGSSGEPNPLATVNAVLNGSAALCLCAGFAAIRFRRVRLHRALMLSAVAFSTLFLVTYVLHHLQVGSVKFQRQGLVRTIYFAILIPHILLAVPVVPLALTTLYRGWTANYARHRALARVTLPLWLFVLVSGVVVYAMLYHL